MTLRRSTQNCAEPAIEAPLSVSRVLPTGCPLRIFGSGASGCLRLSAAGAPEFHRRPGARRARLAHGVTLPAEAVSETRRMRGRANIVQTSHEDTLILIATTAPVPALFLNYLALIATG